MEKFINIEVKIPGKGRHYEGGYTSPKINKILDYLVENKNIELESVIEKFKTAEYTAEKITTVFNDFKNGVYTRIEGLPPRIITRTVINPEWHLQYNGNNENLKQIIEDYEEETTTDKIGHGYYKYSMSNNAYIAYEKGVMPISKWNKKNIISKINEIANKYGFVFDFERLKKQKLEELKRTFLIKAGYHHTSKFYNMTDFYKIDIEQIINNGYILN